MSTIRVGQLEVTISGEGGAMEPQLEIVYKGDKRDTYDQVVYGEVAEELFRILSRFDNPSDRALDTILNA